MPREVVITCNTSPRKKSPSNNPRASKRQNNRHRSTQHRDAPCKAKRLHSGQPRQTPQVLQATAATKHLPQRLIKHQNLSMTNPSRRKPIARLHRARQLDDPHARPIPEPREKHQTIPTATFPRRLRQRRITMKIKEPRVRMQLQSHSERRHRRVDKIRRRHIAHAPPPTQ